MTTAPRPEQLLAFAKGAPSDGPIHMLNLLKFKEKAEYPDGRETDLTGEQAYTLYGRGVAKLIAELGGRIVYGGRAQALVIGDGELAWDNVVIVEYPSVAAFQQMTQSDAYAEIHVHRDAGLAHQLLVHCQPPDAGATPFAR